MNIKKQKSEVRSQKSEKNNSELQTPNSKLFFVLGGARSGKSAYALKLAESISSKPLYLATAEALDSEMAERIKKHKKDRGDGWTTIEEQINIADVIAKNKKYDVILLDCLTLWVSNLMHHESRGKPAPACSKQGGHGARGKKNIEALMGACKTSKANIIIVSNEVGMGIVPDNPLAREFRDIAGYANQQIAAVADEVYFVVAGIAMRMK